MRQVTVPSLPIATSIPNTRWFAPYGCVVDREGVSQVFVGGTLIAQFDPDDRDRGPRNVIIVTLAKVPTMHLGHLAKGFGLSEEYLRELRRLEEAQGLAAILKPAVGGKWRITDEKRAELHALFEAGWNVTDATRRQRRGKSRVTRPTVSREWHRWKAARDSAAIEAPIATAITTVAEQLSLFAPPPVSLPATPAKEAPQNEKPAATVEADEADGAVVSLKSRPVVGGHLVQHVGAWIALALAKRDGLHEEVVALGGAGDQLGISLDAAIGSLAIGERTIEGVRRLATPSAPQLLRANHAPTASTVRRRLWQFADDHGATLMARMSQRYIDAARGDESPAIFYVDNHLRPYTGKQVVRKGWRMQDRRVLPGTTDYYVHDEDGRPVLRVDVPSHDSLSSQLVPIAERLREALGDDERILLAYDRAGSYADVIAALRDANIELVAYERKPYALLAESAFDRAIEIRGEKYRWCEQRLANLGNRRGRVRRTSVRTPDGKQINLLAHSQLGPEDLIGILLGRQDEDDPSGRWQQENAFKHGVERWGINQLDSRKTELYPPGTIIPNPRRRRLERALTIARADEGRARCKLAELAALDARRERVEADLAEAIEQRVYLELMRPLVPKHAAVEDTELAGKLVYHAGERKAVVDTIRIVCANIEADLAEMLAPHLRRPREAKKVVANIFASPGRVDVTTREIRVRLAIAANRSELRAIERLLEQLTAMQLTLPRDGRRRLLRFEVQVS
jgi:hypothetical protein